MTWSEEAFKRISVERKGLRWPCVPEMVPRPRSSEKIARGSLEYMDLAAYRLPFPKFVLKVTGRGRGLPTAAYRPNSKGGCDVVRCMGSSLGTSRAGNMRVTDQMCVMAMCISRVFQRGGRNGYPE